MKITHYDMYGNEFIKFDIIPNLKHLVNNIAINNKTRQKLALMLSRKHTCSICGRKAYYIGYYKQKNTKSIQVDLYSKDGVVFNVDHIIPTSKGGSNLDLNKQCTCMSCNSKKGDILPEGFVAVIKNGKFVPYKP